MSKKIILDGVNFTSARLLSDMLNQQVRDAGKALDVFPRNSIGLTSDVDKAKPEYKRARKEFDEAFKILREFNAVYVKKFSKELKKERDEKRQRGLR